MFEELSFLITGIIFGLTAGLSPGPLLTLVINETIKHGKREGIKVAVAPIITDIPIILLTLFVLSQFLNINFLLGLISLFGAIFIGYLAYESLSTKGLEVDIKKVKPDSLKKGIITNILSPHPYLFWLTVGGTILIKAFSINVVSALLFVLGFYLLLVGSKIMVALLVAKSSSFLKSKSYTYTVKLLGAILFIFALVFLFDSLKFFGII